MLIKKNKGFTLIEILIALFIFSIISVMMVSGLHSVLTTQSAVEKNAARFNQLQMAMILISHDMEQTINRPITNAAGSIENSLIGSHTSVIFTHAGLFNPFGELPRSTLQRMSYTFNGKNLIRETWPVLDQVQSTQSSKRTLLENINEINFEYLDQNNKFQTIWPPHGGQAQIKLPRAIRITITLKNWGKISQTYLIAGQTLAKSN